MAHIDGDQLWDTSRGHQPPGINPREDAMKRDEATIRLGRLILWAEHNCNAGSISPDVKDALNNLAQGSHVPTMGESEFFCWCGTKHFSVEGLGQD